MKKKCNPFFLNFTDCSRLNSLQGTTSNNLETIYRDQCLLFFLLLLLGWGDILTTFWTRYDKFKSEKLVPVFSKKKKKDNYMIMLVEGV